MIEKYDKEISRVKDELKKIVRQILSANERFLDAIKDDCDKTKFDEAKRFLKNISSKIDDIDNLIIKILALYTPEAKDLREVVAYFKIDNELLRMASNTRSLIRGFTQNCALVDKEIIDEYVIPLHNSTIKALHFVLEMIGLDDDDELRDIFHSIIVEEDKTDDLYAMLEKKIFDGLSDAKDFARIHTMLRAFRRSEKITDRTSSIANLLLYISEGGKLKRV